MTTINSFAAGSFNADRTTASLLTLKSRLDGLTNQLSTGQVADTYGGLGSARTASLSAHATISALDGYVASITGGTTQVNLAATSLTQVKKLADTLGNSLTANLQPSTSTGITTSVALAKSGLDGAIDALNQNAAGKYIFGGRTTDQAPVVSADLMLNGDSTAGLAGLKTLIAEQRKADGTDGIGRLQLSGASGSASVTLSEATDPSVRANFGFTINDWSSSNASAISASPATPAAQVQVGGNPTFPSAFPPAPADGDRFRVAVNMPDGSQKIIDLTAQNPGSGADGTFAIDPSSAANTAANIATAVGNLPIASIQSSGNPEVTLDYSAAPAARSVGLTVSDTNPPQDGDTVTVTLGMHDGTTKTVTLTATTTSPPPAGSFLIDTAGADAATRAANTAGNLKTALNSALGTSAQTELSASSAVRASENFFDGSSSAGLAPRRVKSDLSGYEDVPKNNTVIWYTGDDAATDPRATSSVQIGANRSVGIGARANEQPLRDTLAAFATLAADSFTDATGTQDAARFQATASRVQGLVTPSDTKTSVADMVGEFGIASSTMADAKTQAVSTKNTLLDSIEGVEQVSTEEVAAKLMTLQTQLQATYQVTSMLSKLSLVNYLS